MIKHQYLIIATAIVAMMLFYSCGHSQKEIGLQLYSIGGEISKDLEGSIASVSEAGYTFVEAAGYDSNHGTFYGLEPSAFTTLCNKHHLRFLSSHITGPNPVNSSIADCLLWWREAIEDHQEAGVQYIVQPVISQSAYTSKENLDAYCQLFNEVGLMCNEAGIRFGYHNHNREFTTFIHTSPTDSIRLYDYMLLNTDSELVFFQIDLYWATVGGVSPIDYFKAYPGRFELWHVKDEYEIGASGHIDFASIYQYAAISGMKYQIVEQEAFSEGLTPFQSIKASHDFLQNAPYVR